MKEFDGMDLSVDLIIVNESQNTFSSAHRSGSRIVVEI